MFKSRTLSLSKSLRSFTAIKPLLPQQRCLCMLDKKSKTSKVGKMQYLGQTNRTNHIKRNFCSTVSADGNFISSVEEGLRTISFNRESKANSITIPMFYELRDVIKEAADDPNTAITAITGKGRFYSAGFDLVEYGSSEPTAEKAELLYGGLKCLTAEIIEFPKPLIGLVNGPAAGIMVAYLGLMDAVYASDKASFLTPYTALGIVVEGCASFTFPLIMGRGLATEMLLFNKKMSVSEAHQCGLVTEVFPADTFMEQTTKKLLRLTKLPKRQVQLSKSIITHANKKMLHEINELEARGIQECALSPEFSAAIKKFTKA